MIIPINKIFEISIVQLKLMIPTNFSGSTILTSEENLFGHKNMRLNYATEFF